MDQTSTSLCLALDRLDYPNFSSGNAPFNEANIVAHIAATVYARKATAAFYAEAPIPGGGRIDLLLNACEMNFLVEVKVLGAIGSGCSSLKEQLERFDRFSPRCSVRSSGMASGSWWLSAKATHGLALIASHRGLLNAWKRGGSHEVSSSVRRKSDAVALASLLDFLDSRNATFGSKVGLQDMFVYTDPLELLWALYPVRNAVGTA